MYVYKNIRNIVSPIRTHLGVQGKVCCSDNKLTPIILTDIQLNNI